MDYFDPEQSGQLQPAFEHLVDDWSDVTAKTMFGCPSYTADGTLFAVLVTDGVALTKLPEARRAAVADAFETGPFQAGNRTVETWVQVQIDDVAALAELEPFVRASYEAALEASRE